MSSWFSSSLPYYAAAFAIDLAFCAYEVHAAIRDFKNGDTRRKAILEVFAAIAAVLVAILFGLGIYADNLASQDVAKDMRTMSNNWVTTSNRLDAVSSAYSGMTAQLTQATNDLAVATNKLNSLSSDMAAAKIKPPKERLIDFLNSFDARIIPALQGGTNTIGFTQPEYKGVALRNIAEEPGMSEYITLEINRSINFVPGIGQACIGKMHLNPDLLK